MKYDVMVVGSGIAGMESAIKLGDMGYQVLLVEKEASVGGRMILLSKVFPTLDCASCISGPKMSTTINHPNITTMTYSEVEGIRRQADGSFNATVKEKARFVDLEHLHRLPGLRARLHRGRPRPVQCRPRPPARRLHRLPAGRPEEGRHRAGRARRRASRPAPPASRPTATSRSSAAACSRRPSSSSSTPRPSSAPSVAPATPPARASARGAKLEGTIPIRRLKRYVADKHYAREGRPRHRRWPSPTARRIAIVGSGPGRTHRRLAAGPPRLPRHDVRGRRPTRWLPASRDPRLPAARTTSSSRTSPT